MYLNKKIALTFFQITIFGSEVVFLENLSIFLANPIFLLNYFIHYSEANVSFVSLSIERAKKAFNFNILQPLPIFIKMNKS